MPDLSVIIPARDEEWLNATIKRVIYNIKGDTEVIAVVDGYTPKVPLPSRRKLRVLYNETPIGQRASMNAGVRMSNAKYIMKLDAHCAVAPGFDAQLMQDCKPDWTMIPLMYNLHIFSWVCKCGNIMYQGKEVPCPKCNEKMEMKIEWKPRRGTQTYSMRFDSDLHFQYWKQRKVEGDIVDTMSFIGAFWFMERDRYWELEGLDEAHGMWGQVGTEVACKTWLSGGRLCVNKNTWVAHFFRTQFGWPYHITQGMVDRARAYSKDLWFNNKWPKQKYPLKWLVDKFAPVPGWENYEWKLDV